MKTTKNNQRFVIRARGGKMGGWEIVDTKTGNWCAWDPMYSGLTATAKAWNAAEAKGGAK